MNYKQLLLFRRVCTVQAGLEVSTQKPKMPDYHDQLAS